jgi:hypothetical protein
LVELGLIVTVVPGTVTAAEFEAAVLSTAVAVTDTAKSPAGKAAGAEYVVKAPLAVWTGETVPQGAGKQETDHMTPFCAGSLASVAVKFAVVPTLTVRDDGFTEIVIPETVTVAEFEMEELATDVAVTVTGKSPTGGVLGAV